MYLVTGLDSDGVTWYLNHRMTWAGISTARHFRLDEAERAIVTVCNRNRNLDRVDQVEPNMERVK